MTRRRDDGATAVIVVLLVVVLVSMAALVADLGSLAQEKRELQNGADAAALAIAGTCATPAGCGTFTTTAATYANGNARDAQSDVQEICGTGAGMTACADPPTVPAGANYVRVRTSTREASTGGTGITFKLAQLMGFSSETVHAKAVAGWGYASSIVSKLPVTISLCEYYMYAQNPALLPAYPPAPTTGEVILGFHDAQGTPICNHGPSGADLPGGFGWLETTGGCNALPSFENWYPDDTGVSGPTTCTSTLMQSMVGKVVKLPIFTNTNDLNGSNGQYWIPQFADFYVTGFSIPSKGKVKSLITNQFPCTGQLKCISGVFVNDTRDLPVTGVIGGTDHGEIAVQMLG